MRENFAIHESCKNDVHIFCSMWWGKEQCDEIELSEGKVTLKAYSYESDKELVSIHLNWFFCEGILQNVIQTCFAYQIGFE